MEEYYYLSNSSERVGPFSLEQLIAQRITPGTQIWRSGLAQWTMAADVPEVATLLSQASPMPPIPPVPPTPPVPPIPPVPPTGATNNQETRPCPPTHLVWGILATLFCCLPLGIVAIYMSSRVEYHYYNGDYERALKASSSALSWCIACVVIAALTLAAYLIFIFAIASATIVSA